MSVITKNSSVENASAPSAEEVNVTLDKIFDSASAAIKKNQKKVTLDGVDRTIAALFEAVNSVHVKGSKVTIPDFQKILKDAR